MIGNWEFSCHQKKRKILSVPYVYLAGDSHNHLREVGEEGLALGVLLEYFRKETDSGTGLRFILEFTDLNNFEEGTYHETFALWSEFGGKLNVEMHTWVMSDLAFLTAFLALRPLMRYLI